VKDVRIDFDGTLRCWSCGSSNFEHKRTARSKVAFGVAALAAKKKLKCQACGKWNDVGNAKPTMSGARPTPPVVNQVIVNAGQAEPALRQVPAVPDEPKSTPVVEETERELDWTERVALESGRGDEAAWKPDPTRRFELRYWDGSRWTEHVARQGEQFVDPLDAGESNANEEEETSPAADEQRGPLSDAAVEKLRQLAELRDAGVLTDEEFAEQKARLLS
jgi:hypothetical protein